MPLGTIPNDIRVPLVYVEIDNTGAVDGTPALAQKILVLGQQSSAATAAPLTLTRITGSDSEIDALYGKGAMLSGSLKALKAANAYTECYALGIDDMKGQAATGTVVFDGIATKSGMVALLIAGKSVQVAVSKDDTAAAIVTACVDAINKNEQLYVTASVDAKNTKALVLTAKHTGLLGNDLDVRLSYYDGDRLPAGIIANTTAFSGGAGSPDLSAVIAQLGDEWFNHIVMPWNDTQSLNTLRDELTQRWGPLKMIEGIAYTAYRGTLSETGTFGETRNDHLITCMGTNKAPNPTWEWAASYGATAAFSLGVDPARPLQTLVLKGILPPGKVDAWDMVERNLLLHDGIATYQVTPGGDVAIEREISMYRVNAFGDVDPSYLDITTTATLGYLRYSLKSMITNTFPRHKLASDDVLANIDPSQPVVTPKLMRQAILALALEWVHNGLIESYELFADTLQVTRDSGDVNRLNVLMHPDCVNQLRIFAALIQYKL